MGFGLCKNYWKQGYMSEALKELIRYVFEELGVTAIYTTTLVNNKSSNKLQEKIGFKVVGRVPQVRWIDGSITSTLARCLSKEDYFNK